MTPLSGLGEDPRRRTIRSGSLIDSLVAICRGFDEAIFLHSALVIG